MKFTTWKCGFFREPLARPFGFKGSYLTELWQPAVVLGDADGREGLGTGVQSVLWSDAGVFTRFRETGGNCMMLAVTNHALTQAVGWDWAEPRELLDRLLPVATEYARHACAEPHLRLTFVLNALVPVDCAAWQLYARTKGFDHFDQLLPAASRAALPERHRRLAAVPLITYATPLEQVAQLAESGCAMMKIKIGSDPAGDGDREKMRQWDCRRLAELHGLLKDFTCPDTVTGRIAYYLDANGRYDTLARLTRLLDHAAQIGALDRIALLEEPFAEECDLEVGALPVCIVADESAHSVTDARRRIAQGYRAMALKPVAKTLSMSLQVLEAAHQAGVACFCADLTVPPYLLEWNRNVAARLAPLPSMKVGVLESNGEQNYRHWPELLALHPHPQAPWLTPRNGAFVLDDDFYRSSGGLLLDAPACRARCGW